MCKTLLSEENSFDNHQLLDLPTGDLLGLGSPACDLTIDLPIGNLGVHFSNTVPCEICRVDEESPIFERLVQLIGRVAFQFSIPNKIDICGALDSVTLEKILAASINTPNRKLKFKNRSESFNEGIVTTCLLPIGPINASFQSSKGFFKSLHFNNSKIFVERADENFEFPIGHYVEKVIIPNQLAFEGGMRSPEKLSQTLDIFAKVPGRKIVFQKDIPKRGVITKVTLPKGPTGIILSSDIDDGSEIPIVSTILEESSAWQRNVPTDYVVEKLIVPNEITMERMSCLAVKNALDDYSQVDSRILVLQEFRRDIGRAGSKITLTLPCGELGIVFNSNNDAIWVKEVKSQSQTLRQIPIGYYIESLSVPGEFNLIGNDEIKNVFSLVKNLKESSHVPHRVLVLQQYKKDIQKRKSTRFGEISWRKH